MEPISKNLLPLESNGFLLVKKFSTFNIVRSLFVSDIDYSIAYYGKIAMCAII